MGISSTVDVSPDRGREPANTALVLTPDPAPLGGDVMSFPCPHCGGEIVISPGMSPFPGWRNPPQNPPQTAATPPQNGEVAGKILDLDLSNPSAKSESSSKAKYQYTPAFLDFWKAYPLHREKRTAYRCWARAIQRLTATATATDAATANAILIAGAIRYRNDPNRDPSFTKYAEGWLNGDGWEDEPLPARIDRTKRPEPARPMTDGDFAAFMEDHRE